MTATVSLRDLLMELCKRRGSDLILKQGRPPLLRIGGQVLPSEYPPLDDQALQGLLSDVVDASFLPRLEAERELDFGFQHDDIGRFRANVFYQRSKVACVIRAIPLEVPTIDQLGLPAVLKDLAAAPNGIVLVTGPTGSGKSTTLSSMVEHINRTRAAHIITLEDPIEFVYQDKKSTITQRALGRDSLSIERALRAALRQAPDVILAGEMRDRATMELAIHAAETGHLVLSTLHTNDAKQSIDRVLDAFPPDARTGLLRVLSLTLRGILCQRLIPRLDGAGRVAALEIMVVSPNIKQLIEKGQISDISKAIETSQSYYRMQSFNQSLGELVKKRLISEEDALANTNTPGDLKLLLKGMVRTPGTGLVTKDEVEERQAAAGQEALKGLERPRTSPVSPGGAPPERPPGTGTVRTPQGAPGLRAPLRPTGRGAPPPDKPGEGTRPRIQRGFDFQKS